MHNSVIELHLSINYSDAFRRTGRRPQGVPYDCSIWRAGRSNSYVVDSLRMMLLASKRVGAA